MQQILMHELSPLPLSLVKLNEQMNSTSKADLLKVVTTDNGILIPTKLPPAPENTKSCVVIDGHAMIQKLGKPANCQTFADYAEVFMNNVLGRLQGSVTTHKGRHCI